MRTSIIPSQDMNSHQVYKAARKTLPYINNIMTERLKSQSIVDTSLTQALFDDLKNSLSKDLSSASKGLQKVVSNSGQMEANFREALDGQQVDRMKLHSTCIITLVVAIVSVIVIGLMWCHVVSKINHLIEVMSACEERLPLAQSSNIHPLQTTSLV